MSIKVGDRVGAIFGSGDDGTVEFFGYGVYEGEFVPVDGVRFMGINVSTLQGFVNPRIRLDDGKVVFGCECWWGTEEEVRKALHGKTVKMVDIDAIRKGNK